MAVSAQGDVRSLMAVGTRRWIVAVLLSVAAGEIPAKNAHWKTQVMSTVEWGGNRGA